MSILISVIGFCWLIFFLYWGISAFFTKKSVIKRGWWWRIYLIIVVVAVIIFTKRSKTDPAVIKVFFTSLFFPVTQTITIIATILVVIGVICAILARIYLGRNWSGYVTYKKDHELITSGPYRYVRHPIYSGMTLMITGTWLSFPSFWVSSFFIAYIVIFVWRMGREEAIMIRLFGKKYKDYMKHTKRIIPWIW